MAGTAKRAMWTAMACGALAVLAAGTLPAAEAPEMAPTPFTADEIRGQCPAGRLFRFKVEEEGKVHFSQTKFLSTTEQGAEIEQSMLDEKGEVLDSKNALVTWEELRRHALFPRSLTEVTEEKVTIGLGTFEAKVYHVTDPSGKQLHFAFAKARPGPPVKYWAEADGRTVMKAEMVVYE